MCRRVSAATLAIAVLSVIAVSSRESPDATAANAAHVLNRLAFGPRPGDIERVRRAGIAAWIDEQLHPERIDDAALQRRLAHFETLGLDTTTILTNYYAPAMQERRARTRQAESPKAPGSHDLRPPRPQDPKPSRPQDRSNSDRKARLVLAELSEARILRAVYGERQLEEVLTDFWFNHFNVFAGKGPTRAFITSFERDVIRPHVLGNFRQMLEAVATSPAMLFYLDNWKNFTQRPQRPQRPQMPQMTQMPQITQMAQMAQGPQRPQRPQMTQRPQMPQMAQMAQMASMPQMAQMPRMARRGINENFARELLELHTLGVDGGYSQDDIVNVARAFTGWTMRPRQDARFMFVSRLHDTSEKHVLGHTLKAGRGIEDGRDVLDILVAHPSTARFIGTRLAQKFVSDAPPPALVERAARRFTETHGDLREVTRTIVTSPEFLAPEVYRAKVKTPLEFVASAIRATGAELRTAAPLIRVLRDLGMPLYFCQPPTGYDETADTWVSAGAVVARMNFALELGGGRLRGISVPGVSESPDALREKLRAAALGGDVMTATQATIAKAATADQVVALIIGSPDFQRQ